MRNYSILFAALFTLLMTSCYKTEVAFVPEDASTNDFVTTTSESIQDFKAAPKKNILEYIQDNPNYSLFYESLLHTGLTELVTTKDITVFVPTDDAMKAAFMKSGYETIQNYPPMELKKILMCHISIDGKYYFDNSTRGTELNVMYQNKPAYIEVTNQSVTLGNYEAYLINPNTQLINGVVHQVSSVLLPK